ncbi:regulatory protein [Streptomyces xiamenensis]|uniref:Regulatory protein n=1 Tax=Streptomyces xiamenensis TaxID=408015 RepID=A0A0F7FXQ3_9ACTN|nr:regulatory protein [Streptomyces xiamenensis]
MADGHPGVMPVRDSKNPAGPAIVFPLGDWSRFVSAVKDGQLPL